MESCKKFKPAQAARDLHHNNPEGDCRSCVYFSQTNCRQHKRAQFAETLA
ncbi:MAG: hypothetical protein FWD90_04670 [Defluviitaleaceae bacterium]|nr:hypothetical protein [Defluviitaleaceae bacterium]